MGEARRRAFAREDVGVLRERMGRLPQAPNTVRIRAWAWMEKNSGYHQVDIVRSMLSELPAIIGKLTTQKFTFQSACLTAANILLARTTATLHGPNLLDPLLGMISEQAFRDYRVAWDAVSRVEMTLRFDDIGRHCFPLFEFNQRPESSLVPAYLKNLKTDPAWLNVAIVNSNSAVLVTAIQRHLVEAAEPHLRLRYKRAQSYGFVGDFDEFTFAVLYEGHRLHQRGEFATMHQVLFKMALCYGIAQSNFEEHRNAGAVIMIVHLSENDAGFRSSFFDAHVDFQASLLKMVHLALLALRDQPPPAIERPSIRELQLPDQANIWAAN